MNNNINNNNIYSHNTIGNNNNINLNNSPIDNNNNLNINVNSNNNNNNIGNNSNNSYNYNKLNSNRDNKYDKVGNKDRDCFLSFSTTTTQSNGKIGGKVMSFKTKFGIAAGNRLYNRVFNLWRSQVIRQLIVVMQVVFLAYLLSKAVLKFQMLDNKSTLQEFSNSECSGAGQNTDCTVGSTHSFKRVLFFYNDGLARDLSDPLVSGFAEHANVFRIQNEGFPASYAVFTSYMTGGAPTNFMGTPIVEDNMIYQLANSGQTMKFVGTRMPAYDVLKSGNYFKGGVKIESTTPTSKLYQTLFHCELNDEQLCSQRYLNETAAGQSTSIFFSGDIVDERNHMTGDKYDPTTIEIINDWIGNMGYVKQWIDNNPDYLLVIFSDHGGKLTSETAAHGKNNGGNEAFMIIYNPRITPLPPNEQDKFIDQVDVCSTISQHFVGSGVSIPSVNIGKLVPTAISLKEKYQLLKLNADQFNVLGKKWRYKMNQADYIRAIKLGENTENDQDYEEAIKLFTRYINSLKLPFLNLKRFPIFEVVFFPITIALLIAMLIRKQYGSVKNLFSEMRNNIALVMIPYLVIFGITALFSGFWVLYWHDDNESIHVYVASLLSALVMYYAPNATQNIKRTVSKTYRSLSGGSLSQVAYEKLDSEAGDSIEMNSFNDDISLGNTEFDDCSVSLYSNNSSNNSISNPTSPNNNNQQQQQQQTTKLNNIATPSISSTSQLAYEYKTPGQWLIKYAFFLFFMAVSLYLLTVPLEDLFLVKKADDTFCSSSWRGSHVMMPKLAFCIYLFLGLHALVLFFCPRYLQADIFLPISMALFFISNDKERYYLVLFVIPQFYCISNMFYYKLFNTVQPILNNYRLSQGFSNRKSNANSIYMMSLRDLNFFSGITDHFLPFVVLLLASIALSCYKSMKMNFQIGDVAIYVPGVYDPPSRPVFSGFIMGFHKLGYFFLLGAFLIKFANPCPPALFVRKWFNKRFMFGFKIKSNKDYDRIVESLGIQIWGFLISLVEFKLDH
ncbi:hypothetical protein PPL_11315 [Heterostelium album PN500]|uniref:Uncharacterized protein n=1 Tax=Heterostelium pallidum (strain ATCC 26659 / Pp 5 / PN500) TaxID=670386 RepID=D3BT23_HETP5|nr:hypothetical protein PPL_11315 [Heterostelium album PN500]EFA75240.1 hypothetical protein PPL_11315 [Heterostelium album PN500]|eukprot:XP_020427374.1 hypothetical protein PPL_11315 [Heterostelium album PN500]